MPVRSNGSSTPIEYSQKAGTENRAKSRSVSGSARVALLIMPTTVRSSFELSFPMSSGLEQFVVRDPIASWRQGPLLGGSRVSWPSFATSWCLIRQQCRYALLGRYRCALDGSPSSRLVLRLLCHDSSAWTSDGVARPVVPDLPRCVVPPLLAERYRLTRSERCRSCSAL